MKIKIILLLAMCSIAFVCSNKIEKENYKKKVRQSPPRPDYEKDYETPEIRGSNIFIINIKFF